MRMEDDKIAKIVLEGGITKTKWKGRPKVRFYDEVVKAIETLQVRKCAKKQSTEDSDK